MIQQLRKTAEETEALIPKPTVAPRPHFVRCNITGPDGKKRPGWEMWLGEHCFGRSDRKEALLQSLKRQLQPPQSFHWRNVHRQRFERARLKKTQADKREAEEITSFET